MKKFIVVLVLLLAATAVYAQQINLGDFPVGKWLDHNYDAIWEFSSNNIKLHGTDGRLVYDFSGMVQDFRVFLDGLNPGISFACADTERSYRFVIQLNTNLKMEIERQNEPLYTVDMRKQ